MKSKMIIVVLLLAGTLLGAVFAVTAAAAPEATITVDSTADTLVAGDNECTLREAINNANTDSDTTGGDCTPGSGADVITLPAGTYTLTTPGTLEDNNASGDLDVLDDLTIDGAGSELTIVDGNALDRVLHLIGPHLLTLNHLTVSGGYTVWEGGFVGGGGIFNNGGALMINHSTIADNVCDGCNGGGGIFSTIGISITINSSTIRDNQALYSGGFTGFGGGAFLINGDVLIDSSAVISNTGEGTAGGLFLVDVNGTVANSTISGNSTTGTPGNNLTGAGGGILVGIQTSPLPVQVDLVNTTIARNNAGNIGGGLAVGSLTGQIPTVNLVNAIIAYNEAQVDNNCSINAGFNPGMVQSLGYNLEDEDTCQLDQPTDQINTDPLLAPIQDNGGPTWTYALLDFSPAIDAGDDGVCAAAPVNGVDQRGVGRPIGPHCDIGAFESAAMPPIPQFDVYLPVVLKP